MAGLQCHKRLWWQVQEPAAPELAIDPHLQAVFDRGHRVGALARARVPGGVLIDLAHDAYEERLAATRRALEQGVPAVFEAAFRADSVYVSVDILERRPEGFCLTEVKSTTRVKDEHLPDVAVQAHVARRAGLPVTRVEIMHLNRACAYPDLSDLFVRADVTARAEARLAAIPAEMATMAAMLGGPRPDVAIGDHCSKPHECPFTERCWPALPAHHVSTLYRMQRRALAALDEQGYQTIFDLPEDTALAATADRQRRAVQAGRIVVEPRLARALSACVPPMAFLDFETVGLAIPVWNGCHPYDALPVQWSCHVEDAAGRMTQHAWLADGPGDPRPELAERLLAACEPARTIAAYNASFERGCILRLAEGAPHLAPRLTRIAERLVDLLPIVRNHVYHPGFGGSFSLKSVLPALVPELGYDDLAISEGATASVELERLLFRGEELAPAETEQLRGDLMRYCDLDTLGLVRLLTEILIWLCTDLSTFVDRRSSRIRGSASWAGAGRDLSPSPASPPLASRGRPPASATPSPSAPRPDRRESASWISSCSR
jgi:predicted RecB family nuclease